MNALTHLPLLLPLLLVAPATRSTPASTSSVATVQDAASEYDVPVVIWQPQHSNPHELANTLNSLFGGGLISEDVESKRVRAISVDTAILISGPQLYLDRALVLLAELDRTAEEDHGVELMQVREYSLRHLTMDDARVALRPLERQIQEYTQFGQMNSSDNISYIQSRGEVVVHDTAERVNEVFALLERLDVPRQEVLLRCYLIRGVSGGDDPRVPTEVTESLTQLVPYAQFELVSFAMLRSDVTADMAMTDAVGNAEYRMVLDPEAYDVESRRLNFASCRFDIARVEGTARMTRQFETSASLTADEYTVLGGVGADADFLVLHMTLVEGP